MNPIDGIQIDPSPAPVGCERCDDIGIYNEGLTSFRCPCGIWLRHHARRERLKANITPSQWDRCTLANYKTEDDKPGMGKALAAAVGFVAGFDPAKRHGLFFGGPPGGGKTHLAIGIARAVIEHGHRAVFWNFREYLATLRAEMDDSYQSDGITVADSIRRSDLIVVDDIGAERDTGWSEEQALSLLDRILAGNKSAVFTTNLKGADLPRYIGDRGASRLFEICPLSSWVSTAGIPDYRRRNGGMA